MARSPAGRVVLGVDHLILKKLGISTRIKVNHIQLFLREFNRGRRTVYETVVLTVRITDRDGDGFVQSCLAIGQFDTDSANRV